MVVQYKMLINGDWVDSSNKKTFNIINPATEEILAKVSEGTEKDVHYAVGAARRAFDSGVWSKMVPAERSQIIWKLADLLEKDIKRFAELESKNVGKSIKYTMNSDFPFTIDNIRFFAGAARCLSGIPAGSYADFHDEKQHKAMGTSLLVREPIGVIACIVPWNYPLYIAVWQVIPALATGNSVVMKPASTTPLTALEFGKLAIEAGIPKGVFNIITGPGSVVGNALAAHPQVDMICLTGSTETGKEIMKLASSNLKKVHLELGGKAPFIVLEDADLDAATEGAVVGAFLNVGQDCTAATRIYVHQNIHDKFVKMLVEKAKKIKFGNPMNPNTDLGPLANKSQMEKTLDFIKRGKKQGAKLVYGGEPIKNFKKGYYITPAIFTNAKQSSDICQKEIFGPVLSVIKIKNDEDAIEKSNDVIYGLAASIWTKDVARALKIASTLKFGEVWINDHGILVSEMPHGGYKQSGAGRDLSIYSLEEYTQLKHIYIDVTGKVRKPWYFAVYGKP